MRLGGLLVSIVLGLGLLQATSWLAPAQSRPAAARLHVATGGVDAAGCGGPAAPCRTIQRAVDQAGCHAAIKVASGVYSDVHPVTCGAYTAPRSFTFPRTSPSRAAMSPRTGARPTRARIPPSWMPAAGDGSF